MIITLKDLRKCDCYDLFCFYFGSEEPEVSNLTSAYFEIDQFKTNTRQYTAILSSILSIQDKRDICDSTEKLRNSSLHDFLKHVDCKQFISYET